jgi:hypothetical protein
LHAHLAFVFAPFVNAQSAARDSTRDPMACHVPGDCAGRAVFQASAGFGLYRERGCQKGKRKRGCKDEFQHEDLPPSTEMADWNIMLS